MHKTVESFVFENLKSLKANSLCAVNENGKVICYCEKYDNCLADGCVLAKKMYCATCTIEKDKCPKHFEEEEYCIQPMEF